MNKKSKKKKEGWQFISVGLIRVALGGLRLTFRSSFHIRRCGNNAGAANRRIESRDWLFYAPRRHTALRRKKTTAGRNDVLSPNESVIEFISCECEVQELAKWARWWLDILQRFASDAKKIPRQNLNRFMECHVFKLFKMCGSLLCPKL